MACGLAGTALFARTLLLAELALAATAVLLTTLMRPTPSQALLPAASLLLGLATTLALFSIAPAPALLLVGLIPLAGRISVRFTAVAPRREPALFALLPLVLAALAAGWTRWAVGPPLYLN